LVEIGEVTAEADAGIVDEHVEIQSMRCEQGIDLSGRILLADVERSGDDVRVGVFGA
jgi:hypothetical protein